MPSISSYCIGCIIKRQEERIRNLPYTEAEKSRYMKDLCAIIGQATETTTAPEIVAKTRALSETYFGIKEDYSKQKKEYNDFALKLEADIKAKITASKDPLYAALKYARIGNYIDFGALKDVTKEKFLELLETDKTGEPDTETYEKLKQDLTQAKTLVFLTDNCGEIVFDKLLLQEIQKQYPNLSTTVIVRGKAVLNDATLTEAREVGLDTLATLMDNGCDAAGNPLDYIAAEAKNVMESADVIIAKGQGNFESLNGCGMNIYYLFLCKCDWFVNRFGLKLLEGVFINDKDL